MCIHGWPESLVLKFDVHKVFRHLLNSRSTGSVRRRQPGWRLAADLVLFKLFRADGALNSLVVAPSSCIPCCHRLVIQGGASGVHHISLISCISHNGWRMLETLLYRLKVREQLTRTIAIASTITSERVLVDCNILAAWHASFLSIEHDPVAREWWTCYVHLRMLLRWVNNGLKALLIHFHK